MALLFILFFDHYFLHFTDIVRERFVSTKIYTYAVRVFRTQSGMDDQLYLRLPYGFKTTEFLDNSSINIDISQVFFGP